MAAAKYVRGFDDYLEHLPPITFQRLYREPATALAIFRRMLPSLAKVVVSTLLYNEKPIPLVDLQSWIRPDSHREQEAAFSKLDKLRITVEQNGLVQLDSTFKKNFRLALTGGGDHNSFGVPVTVQDEKRKVDVAYLDAYASKKFESILHHMVGNISETKPSEGVMHLLVTSGLMEQEGRGAARITKNGFQFLLQEGNAQIWALLIQYLEVAEQFQLDRIEVLHFLLMLGSLELGQAYAVDTLTKTQRVMLSDLRDYGMVYQRKQSSSWFYPTRLATSLTSDTSNIRTPSQSIASGSVIDKEMASDSTSFIILETNYKLYAYTDSPLQIAILNLFAKLYTRFPNLVIGRISRRSIQNAIRLGITAEQIITYCTTHAHPQLKKNPLILPHTVVDQIRLWEIEGERMQTTPGFLFKEFASLLDFEATVQYARDIGVLEWVHQKKRLMFVTRHEQIADWLKRRAAQAAAKAQTPAPPQQQQQQQQQAKA